MLDLGTLAGDAKSFAWGINAGGQIVGYSEASGGTRRAFLYVAGSGMVDLNTRIDPNDGWELLQASGINAAGQIVGMGRHHGQFRGFRLTLLDPKE